MALPQAAYQGFIAHENEVLSFLLRRLVALSPLQASLLQIGSAFVPSIVFSFYAVWMCRLALAHQSGDPDAPGASLSETLHRTWPILLLSLTITLLSAIGVVLLVVPGLLFQVCAYLAIPAFAAENLSPFQAIQRSFILTEGRRWAIFGAIMLSAIILLLPLGLAMLALHAPGESVALMLRNPLIRYGLSPLKAAASQILYFALAAGFYETLTGGARLPTATIAEVFA